MEILSSHIPAFFGLTLLLFVATAVTQGSLAARIRRMDQGVWQSIGSPGLLFGTGTKPLGLFLFIFRKSDLLVGHRLALKILYAAYVLALIALGVGVKGMPS